jgi:hypothetical protein
VLGLLLLFGRTAALGECLKELTLLIFDVAPDRAVVEDVADKFKHFANEDAVHTNVWVDFKQVMHVVVRDVLDFYEWSLLAALTDGLLTKHSRCILFEICFDILTDVVVLLLGLKLFLGFITEFFKETILRFCKHLQIEVLLLAIHFIKIVFCFSLSGLYTYFKKVRIKELMGMRCVRVRIVLLILGQIVPF